MASLYGSKGKVKAQDPISDAIGRQNQSRNARYGSTLFAGLAPTVSLSSPSVVTPKRLLTVDEMPNASRRQEVISLVAEVLRANGFEPMARTTDHTYIQVGGKHVTKISMSIKDNDLNNIRQQVNDFITTNYTEKTE